MVVRAGPEEYFGRENTPTIVQNIYQNQNQRDPNEVYGSLSFASSKSFVVALIILATVLFLLKRRGN